MATNYGPDVEPRVYVINELKPFISIFSFDEYTGMLQDVGVMETINAPGSAGAEIAVHPNGQWLYCSNRDTSGAMGAILVYNILPNGNLEEVQVGSVASNINLYLKILFIVSTSNGKCL